MALIAGTRLLGEILVADGVTTPEMITAALTRMQTTGERLGEALVALGAVTKDDVLKALAVQNNLPYLFRGELPSPLPVVKNLSPKYLRQYVVCPIAVEGGLLTVATADPLNPMIVDDLRQSTGLDVRIVVSPGEGILEAIDRTYDGAATPLQRIVEGLEEERGPEGEEDVNHLRDMAFEAPVIRLVNLLVENAIAAEASDIHIEPFEDTLRVRYRIDGILFDQESPPRRLRDAVTSRIKLMAEMNIAERRLPQDGRIRVSLHGRRVDIRVSTIPTVHGESIVMRLLDRASVFLPLEKLGFGSECFNESPSDKRTIGFSPAHGSVVVPEVGCGREGLRIRAVGLMLVHISAQDGFTQTARAAMHQHNQLLLAQAEELECPCIKHIINHLQLRKMVATTKGSQSLVEFRGFKFRCSQNFLHVALPRMFKIEVQIGPAVELHITLDKVSLEQSHTAADVAADEVRVDEPLGDEGRPNRAALARMQIRKTDC